jgi:hypothetical protein
VTDDLAILALVGTRQCIRVVNADITATMEALDRQILIITGDAGGVDAHVKRECKRLGFRLGCFHARQINGKWAGLWAGPERNTLVVRIAQRGIVWPATPEFPPEKRKLSAGSWNVVDQFRERKKPVEVREVGWI